MRPEQAMTPERGSASRAFHWTFDSRRTGHVTVAQWPNVSLSVFVLSSGAARIFRPAGTVGTALRVATVAAIVLWSLDEIGRGVNPFRRMLGVVVLLATVANLLFS
jgi:hypothetical protein